MRKQRKPVSHPNNHVAPCKKFLPKTPNQQKLVTALYNNSLITGTGCAGTGKTYTTGMVAAKMLLENRVERIVLTRPNIPTGRTLGHFPGDIGEKLAPWLAPITNVLKEGLTPYRYEKMVNYEILIQPLETIRGMSFENSFVIIDESQNLTIEEIKALTTRIGEGTVMALIGDPAQSDVKGGNDLTRFVKLCNKNDIVVPAIEFDVDDIVRSDICGDLIRMFHKENI